MRRARTRNGSDARATTDRRYSQTRDVLVFDFSIVRKEQFGFGERGIGLRSGDQQISDIFVRMAFHVRTDHRALSTLLLQTGTKRVTARTERWREKISMYDYHVEAIPGVENKITDWLSRSSQQVDHRELPLIEEYVVDAVRQRVAVTSHDYGPEYRDLVEVIKAETWKESERKKFNEFFKIKDELTIHDDLIFRDGMRFVPDKRIRSKILKGAHGFHIGQTRIRARVAELFWLPGWSKDVEIYVKTVKNA